MTKVGIAITTFSSHKTNSKRYKIIERCLDSIIKHTPLKIPKVIVVDQATHQHNYLLKKYQNNFEIVYHLEREGIAQAKNTSILWLLDHNVDILILLDDDVIVKKK